LTLGRAARGANRRWRAWRYWRAVAGLRVVCCWPTPVHAVRWRRMGSLCQWMLPRGVDDGHGRPAPCLFGRDISEQRPQIPAGRFPLPPRRTRCRPQLVSPLKSTSRQPFPCSPAHTWLCHCASPAPVEHGIRPARPRLVHTPVMHSIVQMSRISTLACSTCMPLSPVPSHASGYTASIKQYFLSARARPSGPEWP
jgi:hypothetical protein